MAAAATPRKQPAPVVAAEPRLVLSGKHRDPPETGASAAQNEAAQARSSIPSPTELSDEQTALSRRLAHLEAQLAQLRQRNTELEAAALNARNAVPVSVAAPTPPQGSPQWPLYLLAMGLLATVGVLFARLQRRGRSTPQAPAPAGQMPWSRQDAMPTLTDITQGLDHQSAPAPSPQRMADIPPPPRDDGTEVKEDILDQAEVFMAHGHGELAVHLLQEHLRAAPTESPVPWLLLLDLLLRAGDQTGYAAASDECRRYFNVNLSNYSGAHNTDSSQYLAAYPHVLEHLVQEWNTPGIDALLDELICDDRGGARQGFAPGAYREILLLQHIVRERLPLAA